MLSIGIVGLPNVGKSTLFNVLTKNDILTANYPFATIDPNTGIVPVPDERLEVLAHMYDSNKIVPATVQFIDIAGLVAGASKGEGLGNKFLAHIRETDAIVHLVRAFESNNIVHVANKVSPKDDIETINTELILADIETLEKMLPKLTKEAKADKTAAAKLKTYQQLFDALQTGQVSAELSTFARHEKLPLLSTKPAIYVFNVSEDTLADDAKKATLSKLVAPAESLFVCAKLEEDLGKLSADEKQEFLASYGITETGLNQLIKAAYKTLGLQSYLTAGKKEVRAWTIKQGATAPQAAGVIHTDFERGFIAAQIINYDDLVAAGSELAAKAAGKIQTCGKDYVMQPSDVVEFRFNV